MRTMEIERASIPDVLLIRPAKRRDQRGYFSETFRAAALSEAGVDLGWVQDNHSYSAKRGVVRGLLRSRRDEEGRLYVGPDNGLLLPAADRFGGVAQAHELANAQYSLQPVSRTFHGRDLFSPAAAHLAAGVALEKLGPPLDPDELVRVELPQPEVGHNRIRAVALVVDRFGNVALNLRREQLDQAALAPGTRIELTCHGERFYAVFARTFADAPRGSLILYEDSYGSLALAVSRGSAALLLRVEEGGEIVLDLAVR